VPDNPPERRLRREFARPKEAVNWKKIRRLTVASALPSTGHTRGIKSAVRVILDLGDHVFLPVTAAADAGLVHGLHR